MAGTTATTIQRCTAESTQAFPVQWRALTTNLGHHIDVSNADASHLVILVARDSTDVGADHAIQIGTSDSACSGTSYDMPYSAASLGPKKVGSSAAIKASAFSKLRASGTSHLMVIDVLGPFETARYKDGDGYINISKWAFGSTTCWVGAILLP